MDDQLLMTFRFMSVHSATQTSLFLLVCGVLMPPGKNKQNKGHPLLPQHAERCMSTLSGGYLCAPRS